MSSTLVSQNPVTEFRKMADGFVIAPELKLFEMRSTPEFVQKANVAQVPEISRRSAVFHHKPKLMSSPLNVSAASFEK